MGDFDQDKTYTLKAAETTLAQGCFAVLDTATAGQATNCGGANAGKVIGVLLDSTLEAGKAGSFRKFGYARVNANAAISIGDDLVIAATTGRVASKGSDAHASGTDIVGRAEEAATTQGDLIWAFVNIIPLSS